MRLQGIRINEVSQEIFGQVYENMDAAADELVVAAKQRLQRGINPQHPPYTVVRKGKFASARVSFTPKTGKNKGTLVEFNTDKRWTGRHYTAIDMLKETIRRVNKPGSGSVRVYSGNFKAYWAFMIEKGYTDKGGRYHPGLHYLQGPFQEMKPRILGKIKNG